MTEWSLLSNFVSVQSWHVRILIFATSTTILYAWGKQHSVMGSLCPGDNTGEVFHLLGLKV